MFRCMQFCSFAITNSKRKRAFSIISMLSVMSVVTYAQKATGPIEPLPENIIRGGYDWPCWMGPMHSGVATPTGLELVSKLYSSSLVWRSEAKVPDGRTGSSSENTTNPSVSGGFASPIVADGRLYLYYYEPAGEAQDVRLREETGFENKWRINADDVIICIDCQTGKTLWKRTFPEQGLNFNAFTKSGPCLTPVAYDQKVFAIGSAGRVYGLDAVTGDVLWESTMGPRAEEQEKIRKASLEQRQLWNFNRDLMSSPVVAGGVLVFNDHLNYKDGDADTPDRGNGLMGIDIETGDSLWHVRNCAGGATSPVPWMYNNKEYVICEGGKSLADTTKKNRAVCIDPEDGTVMWEFPSGGSYRSITVSDNFLVLNDNRTADQLSCYRITPQSFEKLWSLPQSYGYAVNSPAAFDGYLYGECKGAAKRLCVELETGTIKNEYNAIDGNRFLSTVIIEDRVLFRKDFTTIYNKDPENFKPEIVPWVRSGDLISAGGYTHPIMAAFADGRMFVRTKTDIVCYDLRADPQSVTRKPYTALHTQQPGLSKCAANRCLYDVKGQLIRPYSTSQNSLSMPARGIYITNPVIRSLEGRRRILVIP